ncbi:MAG: hypothetical protein RL757_1896 [Bacteroidota bacterium]
MAKLKLEPKQLIAMGFPQNAAVSVAMSVFEKHYKHATWETIEPMLQQLVDAPETLWDDEILGKIAEKIKPQPPTDHERPDLLKNALPFDIFGAEYIDAKALHQMHVAMKLPVTRAGALMPDAHSGYGLPIGGVLATENSVIPYGVGVDIGCRMCLSILPIDAKDFPRYEKQFERSLVENTLFGSGREWARGNTGDSEVLENRLFKHLPLLKNLHMKAARQLGTSGSGNHFVEFGIVNLPVDDAGLRLKAGQYVGILSHSGSRGLGATIAGHYTKVAMQKRKLPQEAKHLAWLRLDESEGDEYWAAMNLAGDYASACHHDIHRRLTKSLNIKAICVVENHHNFAWKERHDGRDLIVHRKGATPAGAGVMGIIPGSMTAAGYIVRGRGVAESLDSASHGAGRRFSRSQAKASITHALMKKTLADAGVTLLGGGLDEAPQAYKDIVEVMGAQTNLVDIVGTFQPKIVKMDEN